MRTTLRRRRFNGSHFAQRACFAILLFSIISTGVSVAYSQGIRGQLVGIVTDSAGSTIGGVIVSARNLATNEAFSATTEPDGSYVLTHLAPGRYRVIAEHSGFRKFELLDLRLQMDQTARVDITMAEGEISENVDVTSEAPLVNSDTASLGQVITNREIADIPLNGRNYL